MTHGLDPIRTAVVHPVDTPSLLGAVTMMMTTAFTRHSNYGQTSGLNKKSAICH